MLFLCCFCVFFEGYFRVIPCLIFVSVCCVFYVINTDAYVLCVLCVLCDNNDVNLSWRNTCGSLLEKLVTVRFAVVQ